MSLNRFHEISSKTIVYSLVFGIAFAMLISLFVSNYLANFMGNEIKNREIELLFGAVESGPLALARLQSATISQQSLSRVMSSQSLDNRGIESVQVVGGEDRSFVFANWKSSKRVDDSCVRKKSREYSFVDSLHPFEIKIEIDDCFSVREKNVLFFYSGVASIAIAIVSIVLIVLSILPVAVSIRKAEKILSGNAQNDLKIHFTPIKNLVNMALKSIELEKGRALADLAARFSHDIGSPVSVLNIIISSIELPAEKSSLLKSSLQRINDIASNMLNTYKKSSKIQSLTEKSEAEFKVVHQKTDIVLLVESVVSEKKKEYESSHRGVLISLNIEDFNLKSPIENDTLARTLSNLINNSVESITNSGFVKVNVRESERFNVITILDNGIGIPQELLSRVGQKGFSFGKENGNGLGLYYAKSSIEKNGGKLEILSNSKNGTLITISLPKES